MFKETYHNMNEQLTPSTEVVRQLTTAARRAGGNRRVRLGPAVVAVLVLCFLGSVPVLAANIPMAYEILYRISPSAAQFFKPVQLACEDNGIRMEVVSAYIHGNTAEVYITLQDLTGNRLDESVDLYDSYRLVRPFDSTSTCRLAGYDAETGIATFWIQISEWTNQSIEGDKLTFSLRCFLSQKRTYENVPVEADLSHLELVDTWERACSGGGSREGYEQYVNAGGNVRVLRPGTPIPFAVEGVELTGIGFIDGMLHVQTAVTDNLKNDNNGSFHLIGPTGSSTASSYSLSTWGETEDGHSITYVDAVFDVREDQLDGYRLAGNFTTSGCYTEGSWAVTFPLEVGD